MLAVSGERLYTIDDDGVDTEVGTIAGTLPVSMASNGLEVLIVSDTNSYLWDGTTLATVTDVDYPDAGSVCFVGQYFAVHDRDTGRFYISSLLDGSAWDALDFATAESEPDNLVRVLSDSGDLILMGAKTVETWPVTGDLDFPFQRAGSTLTLGLIGRDAVAQIDNSFIWLASDRTVRVLRAVTPQRVSTHDIERIIQAWPDPDLSRAFAYTLGGHSYWCLWNPHGCVIWDATTGLWHERVSFGRNTWRCATAIQIWNNVYLGDPVDGVIYQADESAHDEAGAAMVREFVTIPQGPGGAPFTLDAVEMEIEVGVGVGGSGQGSDPEVWLRMSRDSGETFGGRLLRSIGARGARRRRVVWRNLGQFPPHGGVIAFGCSDPVRVALTAAWADIVPDLP
jgi:hypothetical protein